MSKNENDILLSVDNLKTHFFTDDGVATAVDGVSYDIPRGKTLALVGESGCGKSVSALSIMRLIPSPPGRIVDGAIFFEGKNLLDLSEPQMRNIRGNDISMIFQEPMTSLNPVFTVGNQVIEAIELHQGITGEKARALTVEMFQKVGIADPEQRVNEYPHQMSGGMRQRVMIAMALVCNPKLLIADEPTTALDVTIQAQILDLLRDLQKDFGMSILLITHDLGVVAEMAKHVAVMYASKIVEYAEVNELFDNALHPYTVGLFKSLPKLNQEGGKLNVIEGTVPNPLAFPDGCHFWPRCPLMEEKCKHEEPPLDGKKPGHTAACWMV
ncbi:MAG: ABC transporter ATP-binding protein [Planctomycetes bacterium]|nr:ABC transporter ATP-binding protein [Planctomycetota bacterium]